MLNWFRSKKALVKQIEELTQNNEANKFFADRNSEINKNLRKEVDKAYSREYTYKLMIKNTNAENAELKAENELLRKEKESSKLKAYHDPYLDIDLTKPLRLKGTLEPVIVCTHPKYSVFTDFARSEVLINSDSSMVNHMLENYEREVSNG